MILSSSPRVTTRPAPVCGSRCMRLRCVMKRRSSRDSVEWAAPLDCRGVALANLRPKPLVAPFAAESLEQRMRVEDQCGPAEATREPGAVGMQSDHEECASPEAEREVRVVGIRAHRGIPPRGRVVTLVQALELRPQASLERALARGRAASEYCDERGET